MPSAIADGHFFTEGQGGAKKNCVSVFGCFFLAIEKVQTMCFSLHSANDLLHFF